MLTAQPVTPADDPPRERLGQQAGQLLDGVLGLLMTLLVAFLWATHILVCVTGELWGLLTMGLLIVPVAIVHGAAVWVAGV